MTSPKCPAAFTAEIRRRIIDAVRAGYAAADERYAPEQGVGERSYGMIAYEVLTYRLREDVASDPSVAFEWHADGPCLRIGGIRVRWNKVGRGRAGETITTSFPRPSGAAAQMAFDNRQMTLWGDEAGSELGSPVSWIICHMGNPRDGLRAVYLAAPINADGEQIIGWRVTIPIWNADDPLAEFPTAPEIGLPEAAPLPEFEITLIDDIEDAGAAR
ncbi:MAG TPA: hypothetical protein VF494_00965 [Candidatus Limnocylindrales bacterium]